MKRYIRSNRIADLEAKLERAKQQERERAVTAPVIDAIQKRYAEITGFNCSLQKQYYIPETGLVLLAFTQDYNWGVTQLTFYRNPGRAKISNPAAIPVDASIEMVDEFVDPMVSTLIDMIRHTFTSRWTLYGESNPDPSDEGVTALILRQASIADEQTATQFIYSLLDSGEVVNELAAAQ